MNTTQLEYWRLHQGHVNKDQHPGCHTHASGFDYVPYEAEADKAIDECWRIELQRARQKLVQLLAKHL